MFDAHVAIDSMKPFIVGGSQDDDQAINSESRHPKPKSESDTFGRAKSDKAAGTSSSAVPK